ncbi:prolyl-tRNA synthetase associated domain-containing protein [Novosphingobium beihaiensis]|uniref:Prolyl-tRNA synthetase associated domain-containing protein n=1 Tax=Novosphingobium beihaiensis TaxID=2930389 RepID=A0ABT0BU14_9SPHN|nr:prolyl-tRNA synthetase associated domain-containing protein [Novosphingobium beihaiensis]MCJ2188545.1 prolyl-tRNA synthetase associated domain-containing protein [Novosphingobium beihaiensis]
MSEPQLFSDLESLGAGWAILEHAAVFTVEESAQLHADMPGAHTKNLFLKDAKGGFWLVTVRHDLRVDLKALAGVLEAKKFSFGKAEDMEALLGVTPGAVTPLAAINDKDCRVRVVLDKALADAASVNVHPLRNTATVGLSGQDLQRALAHWNHPAVLAEIPERP